LKVSIFSALAGPHPRSLALLPHGRIGADILSILIIQSI
jgi:hypothetical protein